MSALNGALQQVGVDLGTDVANNLIGAVTDFNRQNLSPNDLATADAGLRLLSQATGIGALSPGVVTRGTGGVFEPSHYANDLNHHHPKFKFLFKVNFIGFPGDSSTNSKFSYYVHRCDKPRVRFNHADMNYYSFRTRVLTSVTFEPLTFSFLDEIGNTVNAFFSKYLLLRSNQGAGLASIDGGSRYSSTIPYDNGYSSGENGSKIEIQQIFGNGLATNIFTLINARIENLDFDDLAMDQNLGSMLNCTVSYDAITSRTTGPYSINSWGQTDLYAGGGTTDHENAHQSSIPDFSISSASGGGIGGETSFLSPQNIDAAVDQTNALLGQQLVPSLADLGTTKVFLPSFNQPFCNSSNTDILSSNIQSTIKSIANGSNLSKGGLPDFSKVVSTTATNLFADASSSAVRSIRQSASVPVPKLVVNGGFGGGL